MAVVDVHRFVGSGKYTLSTWAFFSGLFSFFCFLYACFSFETCLLEGNQSSDVCVLEVYLI